MLSLLSSSLNVQPNSIWLLVQLCVYVLCTSNWLTGGIIEKYVLIVVVVVVCKPKGYGIMDNDMIN